MLHRWLELALLEELNLCHIQGKQRRTAIVPKCLVFRLCVCALLLFPCRVLFVFKCRVFCVFCLIHVDVFCLERVRVFCQTKKRQQKTEKPNNTTPPTIMGIQCWILFLNMDTPCIREYVPEVDPNLDPIVLLLKPWKSGKTKVDAKLDSPLDPCPQSPSSFPNIHSLAHSLLSPLSPSSP